MIRHIGKWLLTLLLLLSLSIAFFLTPFGLQTLVALTERFFIPQLQIGQVHGSLLSPVYFQDINFENTETKLYIRQAQISWSWKTLFEQQAFIIDNIKIDSPEIQTKSKKSKGKLSLDFPEIAAKLKNVKVKNISWQHNQNFSMHIELVTLSAVLDKDWELTLQTEKLYQQEFGDAENNYLNFTVSAQGSGSQAKLQIEQLSGAIEDHPVSGDGSIIWQKNDILVNEVVIDLGESHFYFNGHVDKNWDLTWKVAIPNLKNFFEPTEGSLFTQGSLQGEKRQPTFKGMLSLENFSFENLNLKDLVGDVEISPFSDKQSLVSLKSTELNIGTQHLENMNLILSGNKVQQTGKLTVIKSKQQAQMTLQGQLQQDSWQGEITELTLNLKPLGDWELFKNQGVFVSKQKFTLGKTCLREENKKGAACLSANWQENEALAASADITLNGQHTLEATLNLPEFSQDNFNETEQPVQGDIKFSTDDLSFISSIYPPLQNPQGQLEANLQIKGSLAKPKISGEAKLTQASALLSAVGITLEQINADLQGKPDGSIDYRAKMSSASGHVQLSGKMQLNEKDWPTQISITGEQFQTVNSPTASIYASPDLKIDAKMKSRELSVNGTILIPKAKIHPKDLSGSASLSDDVTFVNNNHQPQQQDDSWNINGQIKLSLGEDAELDFMGLTGKLTGGLQLSKSDQHATFATGQLSVVEGKYSAYGQSLTIEQGELIFTGGALNNPGLNVRAIRQTTSAIPGQKNMNAEMTVGISILGTIQEPEVSFFSQPPGLSQSEILSYLVLGQPLGSSTATDAGLLFGALSSSNITGGKSGMLKEQMQHKLGLDELAVTQTSSYDSESESTMENTALTLGKMLSPKLFVSYSLGLFEPVSIFKISYRLSKHFRIQSNAGVGASAIDLFYTVESKN